MPYISASLCTALDSEPTSDDSYTADSSSSSSPLASDQPRNSIRSSIVSTTVEAQPTVTLFSTEFGGIPIPSDGA